MHPPGHPCMLANVLHAQQSRGVSVSGSQREPLAPLAGVESGHTPACRPGRALKKQPTWRLSTLGRAMPETSSTGERPGNTRSAVTSQPLCYDYRQASGLYASHSLLADALAQCGHSAVQVQDAGPAEQGA